MDYLLESQKQRRDNLKRLLADYSTQRDFGEAVGLAGSQISHILTGRREMGDEIARRIEKALGKPLGWMDRSALTQEPALEMELASLPADQSKLLLDYKRLSPKHQEMVRETAAGYLALEQRRKQQQQQEQ